MIYSISDMSKIEQLRVEAMCDILEHLELSIPNEKIEKIVEDFVYHLKMEDEMSSYAHSYSPREECYKCKNLEWENKELKKEVKVYQDSVKSRRNASAVWIENGEVRYEH